MRLDELEMELGLAREYVGVARTHLAGLRDHLEGVETRVRKCWARRKAAQESLNSTLRAAIACGLSGGLSTALSTSRFQRTVAVASDEIREIIDSSSELCRQFEAAWDSYLEARQRETVALKNISSLEVVEQTVPIPDPVWTDLPTGPLSDHTSSENSITRIRLRRAQADSELRQLEKNRADEETVRRLELALSQDGHYDPGYDEHELLLRRIRPWV